MTDAPKNAEPPPPPPPPPKDSPEAPVDPPATPSTSLNLTEEHMAAIADIMLSKLKDNPIKSTALAGKGKAVGGGPAHASICTRVNMHSCCPILYQFTHAHTLTHSPP